jgi:hypothetical protein
MRVKNIIERIVVLSLISLSILMMTDIAQGNDDLSLRLELNGDDISEAETVTIDPEKALRIDLQIYDVTGDVILKSLSVSITFAGQAILTQNVDLGSYYLPAGESYRNEIIVDIKELLTYGDRPLATGKYRGQLKLEYSKGGQEKAQTQWNAFHIPGNPLSTPAGAAGVVVGTGTLAAIFLLARSLVVPAIPIGATLSSSISIQPQISLRKLAMERLEPTTRGRMTGSIVNAAKKLIVKGKCPICETRLKHGYCYTCRKSAKDVRHEYTAKLKDLALQTGPLINNGHITTLDELCLKLSISRRLGADVITTLAHAKMIKIKGLAHKLMGKAVMAGIGSGLSIIIWVTIGGFAFLSAPMLITILVASIVIPLVVTKTLQIKARHEITKSKH